MMVASYYDDVSGIAFGLMVETELRLKECLNPFRLLLQKYIIYMYIYGKIYLYLTYSNA